MRREGGIIGGARGSAARWARRRAPGGRRRRGGSRAVRRREAREGNEGRGGGPQAPPGAEGSPASSASRLAPRNTPRGCRTPQPTCAAEGSRAARRRIVWGRGEQRGVTEGCDASLSPGAADGVGAFNESNATFNATVSLLLLDSLAGQRCCARTCSLSPLTSTRINEAGFFVLVSCKIL